MIPEFIIQNIDGKTYAVSTVSPSFMMEFGEKSNLKHHPILQPIHLDDSTGNIISFQLIKWFQEPHTWETQEKRDHFAYVVSHLLDRIPATQPKTTKQSQELKKAQKQREREYKLMRQAIKDRQAEKGRISAERMLELSNEHARDRIELISLRKQIQEMQKK